MSSSHLSESLTRLEGPDYVALLIEWDDEENAVTLVSAAPPSRIPMIHRKIATIVAALSAIALATWGLRRLGMAS